MSRYQPLEGFLIDPLSQRIIKVPVKPGIDDIYRLIQADTFDVAYFNDNLDCVFIDDNGLLHEGPKQFFYINGLHQPMAGRGLVLGTNGAGESVNPTVTREWLVENTGFVHQLVPGAIAICAPDAMARTLSGFFTG